MHALFAEFWLEFALAFFGFFFAVLFWPPPCQPDSRAAVCGRVKDLAARAGNLLRPRKA
jgi:hypothetical protein